MLAGPRCDTSSATEVAVAWPDHQDTVPEVGLAKAIVVTAGMPQKAVAATATPITVV